MATEQTHLELDFLARLAQGGFAEKLTPQQRHAIHITTRLDDYIENALEDGKQIVLTGNPGDGKTQYILRKQADYPEPDYFYLHDASEFADYGELLSEWADAFNNDTPGMLAINDGPLYEMTTPYADEYPFLETVESQFQHQIVYDDSTASDIDFDDLVVIDLNNRNVLTRKVVLQAIENLTEDAFLEEDHDHSGACHIQYNIQKLQNDTIKDNFKWLLKTVGKLEEHVTVRDLLNFLAYCITGGQAECDTDFGENLKYYNLAFQGSGKIFDLLNEYFSPEDLTHPFIDSTLWADAEERVSPRDSEDLRDDVQTEFLQLKRRFYFEDTLMDIGFTGRDLYHEINYPFLDQRNNPEQSEEGMKEETIEMINGYFSPGSSQRSELRLWQAHNYRSKSSLVLISRTKIPKYELERKIPDLHPAIREAMDYTPTHHALEYTGGDFPVRLRITRELSQSLSALDANVPYLVRDREEEQQLLEFMEEIEYQANYSEVEGRILIKDTESGEVEALEVHDGRYRVDAR